MKVFDPSRRRTLGGLLAGCSLLRSQQDPFRDHSRVPGLNEVSTVLEFEAAAHAKLPREVYDYTAYGAGSEFTLRRNREAFEWVQLVPRAVADVSSIQTATEVLGTKMAYPILIAPTAGHAQLHPKGELATHQGATAASNTPFIVSNNTSFPIDKVAEAATGPLWFQLYPRKDMDESRDWLEKAQTAGCKAVVATIDQVVPYYERALHDRHLSPPSRGSSRAPAEHNPYRITEYRLWYEWKYLDQIRPLLKVPLLAKGVLTAEDAKICLEHGLDGIIVSNHGGRSLDYGPSTLEVLPEIVNAVQGKIPILIDGGFRCGSDILKALALGAKAVCAGRAPRWGLSAYGVPGVQRVLEILQRELVQAMTETGRPTLASIDSSLVRTHFR